MLNMINNTSSGFYHYEEPLLDPDYTIILPIEKNFSLNAWRKWFAGNWIWSMYLSAAYFVGIHFAQRIMKNRTPFEIRKQLTIWNTGLAIFSLIGTFRTGEELIHILGKDGGLYASICLWKDHNVAASAWGCLFVLSKAFELGDTIFIVLRKQKLLFLHWYHHVTVLCYTWYTFEANPVTSRWFGVMNYAVHTIMYSYYAMKSLKFRVPRIIAMIITTSQIIQMLMGIYINLYAAYKKITGVYCFAEMKHIQLALLMYFSYFVLFAKFFHDTYFKIKSVAPKNSEIGLQQVETDREKWNKEVTSYYVEGLKKDN